MILDAISELRAFGQGSLICDQSPRELHPAVLRGTNIKIVHRLLEASDREAAADAIGLTEIQRDHLGSLPRGRAVVRASTWKAAVCIDVVRAGS